jgi:hypothetical protein
MPGHPRGSPSAAGELGARVARQSAFAPGQPAGATEAVAEKGAALRPAPTAEAVRALLADAESGAAQTERRTLRTHVSREETARSAVFTTDYPLVRGKSVHKSYLKK